MKKTCTKCGEEKPLDAFRKVSRRKDGRGAYCKACGALDTKAWVARNHERKAQADADYRVKNLARLKAYQAEYRAEHSKQLETFRKLHYLKNKQSIDEKNRRWRLENPERWRSSVAIAKSKDPKKYRSREREWHERNPESSLASRESWRRRNAHIVNAGTARRRARKRQATPAWADKNHITQIYADAAKLTTATGVPHHVDHIVPLTSKFVCGLHCEANLQVLEKPLNIKKSNKHWPDMWV